MRRALLVALLFAGCRDDSIVRSADAAPVDKGQLPPPGKDERRVVLFFTAELRGTLEPCGCNSDPLGGIARTARLILEEARRGAVLLVDAGNLLFPEDYGKVPAKVAQLDLRAALLAALYRDLLHVAPVRTGRLDPPARIGDPK